MTTIKDNDVFILSIARTPIGAFNGVFSSTSAVELGAFAIRGAVERSGISATEVEEVYMGHVISAGSGQASGRQAAMAAGIPNSVPCTTVNKVCSSGMKSTMIAAQQIRCGDSHVIVAGGMENMSRAPYLLDKARFGYKMGNHELIDAMMCDGLMDAYENCPMGVLAERNAEDGKVSREAQDDYAVQSFNRVREAQKQGHFDTEIYPVTLKSRRGTTVVSIDEQPDKINLERLRSLRPAFKPNGGSITAGNCSPLSDGACASVLVSGAYVKAKGLKPVAQIVGWGDAAREPENFGLAPALAIPKALKHAGVAQSEVSFFEINEAFAVVALENMRILGLNPAVVNKLGGAVSMGHPLGTSGSRIMATLLSTLTHHASPGDIGCAGICNGGGGSSAMVLKLLRPLTAYPASAEASL